MFPLFRSDAQGRVLAAILFSPLGTPHVSAIAQQADLPVSTVHREVERLEQAGLLASMRIGRQRHVGPRLDSPYLEDVRAIVLKTYGPPAVVAEELSTVDGVEEAHVFGSWAARARGLHGPPARDIDVLVVGEDHNELSVAEYNVAVREGRRLEVGEGLVDDVYAAARRAEDRLGLEVNPVIVGWQEWNLTGEDFVKHLKDGPTMRIL